MRHRSVVIWVVGSVVVATIAGVAVRSVSTTPHRVQAPRGSARTFTARSGVNRDARTGDVIRGTAAAVHVPRAGHGQCAVADIETRGATPGTQSTGSETVCVQQAASGSVRVRVNRQVHAAPRPRNTTRAQGRGIIATCGDPAYAYFDTSTGTQIRLPAAARGASPNVSWYMSNVGMPSYLNAAEVLNDAKMSISNWVTNRNSCGSTARPGLTSIYRGTTTKTPSRYVIDGIVCPAPDGYSVVGWAGLSSSTVDATTRYTTGLTCLSFTSSGYISEADIALTNVPQVGWQTSGEYPAPETNASIVGVFKNVEDVLTHERGHAIGLRHPLNPSTCHADWSGLTCRDDPYGHPQLTMGYPEDGHPMWDTRRVDLAAGDTKGLLALYP